MLETYCTHCGEKITEGYNFCPKCGANRTASTSVPDSAAQTDKAAVSTKKSTEKSAKSKPVIIVCAAAVLILLVCIGFFRSKPGSPSLFDDKAKKVDYPVSWANMKVDDDSLNLTEEHLRIIEYFDDDYLSVYNYDNLQRYPIIYRNVQVCISGVVTKILQADDETYECLFCVNAYTDYPGGQLLGNPEQLIVIKGKQQGAARVTEGDNLACYGRYLDVEPFTVDGNSSYYPTMLAYYSTLSGVEGTGPRFDAAYVKSVAKAILGEDIKIKEPAFGEDFVLDEFHSPQYGFLLVTPDNQSNSSFSKFEFSLDGFIRSADLSSSIERLFYVAADFEHYIVSNHDRNLNLMYLEYYDRDFNKVWGREFENVDSVPYDYTADLIVLAADNDLYMIDIETGKDLVDPVLVGKKVAVNITQEGIILIGAGNKDNVMKVDEKGQPIWKTSVDLDVTDCYGLQIVDGNIVANLEHLVEERYSYGPNGIYEGTRMIYYRSEMVAVDSAGEIISQFTDFEYGTPPTS